jgi:hypothetical protein
MTRYRLRVSLYPNPPLFEPEEADEADAAVWREIEVDASNTLVDLHMAIFAAFDRREHHAYQFVTQAADGMITRSYVPPDMYDGSPSWPLTRADKIEGLLDRVAPADASEAAKDRFRDLQEEPPPEGNAAETTIADLTLAAGGAIYYLFDFDEEWEHAIETQAIDDGSLAGEPVVVDKQGDAPHTSLTAHRPEIINWPFQR